jgi:hypothetical protein
MSTKILQSPQRGVTKFLQITHPCAIENFQSSHGGNQNLSIAQG